MPLVYKDPQERKVGLTLSLGELASIYYHDIFDFPLIVSELNKWNINESTLSQSFKSNAAKKLENIQVTNGYLHLKGRADLVIKRKMKTGSSRLKLKKAKKAAGILAKIPSIKFIGITGSLAMNNAGEDSDIDFLIITSSGLLWTSRLVGYVLLKLTGVSVRSVGDRNEKDKICLNIWMDESALKWPKSKRNIFTAHEIAQIKPLVNKDKIHEHLLSCNFWTSNYWSAISVNKLKQVNTKRNSYLLRTTEFVVRNIQLLYMRNKITREVVTNTRALFHPVDWSKIVINRYESLLD